MLSCEATIKWPLNGSAAHFTQGLWAYSPNFLKDTRSSYVQNDITINSQFPTRHNSSLQLSCTELWPDWILRIRVRANRFFTSLKVGAPNAFVKWSNVHMYLSGKARTNYRQLLLCFFRSHLTLEVLRYLARSVPPFWISRSVPRKRIQMKSIESLTAKEKWKK